VTDIDTSLSSPECEGLVGRTMRRTLFLPSRWESLPRLIRFHACQIAKSLKTVLWRWVLYVSKVETWVTIERHAATENPKTAINSQGEPAALSQRDPKYFPMAKSTV